MSGAAWLAQGAHDAAVRGDCASAHDLARRAEALDATYAERLASDPVLAACVVQESASPPSMARVVTPVSIEKRSPAPRVGPVSVPRAVGQSVLGLVGTIVVGGLALAPFAAQQECESDEQCNDPSVVAIFGIAGGVGAALGVAIGGYGDDGDASGAAALIGGVLGGLASWGVAQTTSVNTGFALALVLPTVGAMGGYYVTRDEDDESPPPITLPAPALTRGERVLTIPLGRIDF